MVIVMPNGGTSIHDLTNGLDSAKWQTWMAGLSKIKAEITLPKFKFSYGATLNNALADLGLGLAFSDYADFSLINPTIRLKISKVVHKAFVETDESGTTAAAATSVGVVAIIAPAPLPPVNHPFMFAIREMNSGLIVFVGTVNNPLLSGE
jgi:serpin B